MAKIIGQKNPVIIGVQVVLHKDMRIRINGTTDDKGAAVKLLRIAANCIESGKIPNYISLN